MKFLLLYLLVALIDGLFEVGIHTVLLGYLGFHGFRPFIVVRLFLGNAGVRFMTLS